MNTKTPQVFISSVISDYKGIRDKITRIIKDEFEWDVWCAGTYDSEVGGPPSLSVCLKRVEWADLYIGIFGREYGTKVIPPGLGFTELEYHHAVKNRKALNLYIEPERLFPSKTLITKIEKTRQQCFLELVQGDPHIGKYVHFFSKDDLSSFYNQVRSNLKEFEKLWISRKLETPQFYLMDILNDLVKIQYELSDFINIGFIRHSSGSFNKDLVKHKLREMSFYYDKKSFCDSLNSGFDILYELIKVPPLKYENYRRMWASFLEKWINTYAELGNWGSFGPIPATKALIQIYQSLEDFQSLYGTANSLASLYYSKGLTKKALIWSNLAKSIEGPPSREMSKYSVRGRILLRLKYYCKEAEECFRNCLDINSQYGFSEASYGLHYSGLGLAEIGLGREKEGMIKLEKGKIICEKNNNPGFTVRTKIAYADHLRRKGGVSEAKNEIIQSIKISKKYKLDQLLKITPLALSLEIDPLSVEEETS